MRIYFTKTSAKLTSDKVAKYRENFDTYFKPGHKKLMHSIKLAEEILGGKVSLEGNRSLKIGAKFDFFSSIEQRDRLKDKDGAAVTINQHYFGY